MAYTARIEIHGIKEALAEINSFDPKFRKQITKDIVNAGQKIITSARSLIKEWPNSKNNGAPLSGMVRGTLIKGRDVRWTNDKAKAGFKVKVNASTQRQKIVNFKTENGADNKVLFKAKPYQLMVIQQKDAAGSIYDHAGRNITSIFVTNLNAETTNEPRAIDPAVEMHQATVEQEVLSIVEKVMSAINKNMQVRYGN